MKILDKWLVDYQTKNRYCYFCGIAVSVKYDVNIEFDEKEVTVACCNGCLFRFIHSEKKI